jgi:hypothetical protein
MVKKVFRSMLAVIFGAAVAVNLLLAFAPATSVSASELDRGDLFTNSKGTSICLCTSGACQRL